MNSRTKTPVARHAAVIWPPLTTPAAAQFKPIHVYVNPDRPSAWVSHVWHLITSRHGCAFLLLSACPYALAVACKVKLPPGWTVEKLAGAIARGPGRAAA